MANRIKVVIVDDSEQTRDNIASIISFEKDIEIVGEAEKKSYLRLINGRLEIRFISIKLLIDLEQLKQLSLTNL